MTFFLFVYGTLKSGGCRHYVLRHQRCLGDFRTTPLYALYDLGAFPGLVHAPDDGQSIEGELYEVQLSLQSALDAVEGAPSLFALESIELQGFTSPVKAYFFQPSLQSRNAVRVQAGLWNNDPPGESS